MNEPRNDRSQMTSQSDWTHHTISVTPLPGMISMVVCKRALLTYDGKSSPIFYQRRASQIYSWGKPAGEAEVIYKLGDDMDGPIRVLDDKCGYLPTLTEIGDRFSVTRTDFALERYSDKSALQAIILGNSEQEGVMVFHKIFNELERIEAPPPLRDE